MPSTTSRRSTPMADDEGARQGKPRGRTPWTWNDINLVLDVVLMLVFAAECFAAVIVRHAFPPGPGAAGWKLWGLDYNAWGGIQFGLLAALAGGILLHVMFHWSWVCTMVANGLWRGPSGHVNQGMQPICRSILLISLPPSIGFPRRGGDHRPAAGLAALHRSFEFHNQATRLRDPRQTEKSLWAITMSRKNA